MFHTHKMTGAAALVGLGTLLGPSAIAQSPSHAGVPLATLKAAYLRCERAAVVGRLASGDIMLCSVVYEELKRRAFDGDFPRLKAWADTQLRPTIATTRKVPTPEASTELESATARKPTL
jgi:hypothetical protein